MKNNQTGPSHFAASFSCLWVPHTQMMISSYCMQRKHYTLISVGPALLKSTGQALYHSHHGLVDSPAFQSVGAVHEGAQTCNLQAGDPAISN